MTTPHPTVPTVRELAGVLDAGARALIAAHHGGEILASWEILWGDPGPRPAPVPAGLVPGPGATAAAGEPDAAASPGEASDATPPPPVDALEGLGTRELTPENRRRRAKKDRSAGRDVAWGRRDPDPKVRATSAKAARDLGLPLDWARRDSDPGVRFVATRADQRNAQALADLGVAIRHDRAQGVHVFRRGDLPEQVLTGDVMRALRAEIQQKFGWLLPKAAFFATPRPPRVHAGSASRGELARPNPHGPARGPERKTVEPVVVRRPFPRVPATTSPPARTSTVVRDVGREVALEFRAARYPNRRRG